jgi:hypothetical protein
LQRTPEPFVPRAHTLHDVSTLALLALVLVPLYLLLNQYWKSLILLSASYIALGFLFWRLGRYVRRVMRHMPAEISPWYSPTRVPETPLLDMQFSAAEAMQSVHKDPYYLQDVLKPRLRQLLVYRMSGTPDTPLEGLDIARLARIEPAILDFLQRREATGLWAKYWYRQQRVQDVLAVLRYLEAL